MTPVSSEDIGAFVLALARSAVQEYVRSGRAVLVPEDVPDGLSEEGACFVSLKISGELRGCIGTLAPTTQCLAAEIVQNAVSACSADPRFMPVTVPELSRLCNSVDVLSEPQAVEDLSLLDPKIYGVIVSSGGYRGVLLPDLDGVDSVGQQIDIARQKAGIPFGAKLIVERFTVRRYGEN